MQHARTHKLQLSGPTVHSLYCGSVSPVDEANSFQIKHVKLNIYPSIFYKPYFEAFSSSITKANDYSRIIELDKHWNDNSSILSDLWVNPRWRKLMYDNYEGRKQT